MGKGFIRLKVMSDGNRDFIEVPPDRRVTLGAVSAAKAVMTLAASPREARGALDSLLKNGHGTFMGDPERLAGLFERRWAVLAKALISPDHRIPMARERTTMASDHTQAALTQQIDRIEAHISRFASQAKTSTRLPEREIKALRDLVGSLDADFGAAAAPALPSPEETTLKVAINDNAQTATNVLRTVEATNETIDRLVEAGKRFNASKAKADLHKIASQVSEIVSNVDLSAGWVKNDLLALSKRADEIHGLFPKEV